MSKEVIANIKTLEMRIVRIEKKLKHVEMQLNKTRKIIQNIIQKFKAAVNVSL